MRRLALLFVAVAAVLPAAPAQAGFGHCVSSGGVTVCPQAVSTCSPGDIVDVQVVGFGSGTAACGDASVSCRPLRGACSVDERTSTAGVLTCSSTDNAVAYCSIATSAN